MRVIAGTARGLPLFGPEDRSVRPTLDRVREATFSILLPRLEGARFLDCFAGTGANGIEALSRGAAEACFLEESARVCALIRQNLARTRLHDRGRVIQASLPQGFARVSGGPFDIVYADPPHSFTEYTGLWTSLVEHRLLAPGGLAILEHEKGTEVPEEVAGLRRVRQSSYGRTTLSFWEPAGV